MTSTQLAEQIRRGEVDINNQSLFFGILIKGLLISLRQDIRIRGEIVPHYIPQIGDETMMLEVKGQDHSIEPIEVSNENFVYTQIPRCAVQPKGISLLADQLTSPYSNGVLQYESEDNIITLTAEFRRMPVKLSVDLEYLVGSFTDYLTLVQQVVTKMAFQRKFRVTYMGQTIECSYNIPDSFDGEHSVDFDLASTEDRRHHMTLSIEVETNMPIYNNETVIPTDKYIKPDPNTQSGAVLGMRIVPHGGIAKGDIGEDPHEYCDHPKLSDRT